MPGGSKFLGSLSRVRTTDLPSANSVSQSLGSRTVTFKTWASGLEGTLGEIAGATATGVAVGVPGDWPARTGLKVKRAPDKKNAASKGACGLFIGFDLDSFGSVMIVPVRAVGACHFLYGLQRY